MSDRKYRQRGYQNDNRDRQPARSDGGSPSAPRPPREPGAPAGTRRISADGPKHVNMPGFRQVVKCSQCGTAISGDVGYDSRCTRCGVDLHTCAQCASFDPGSHFECMQAIAARVTPKNEKNGCELFGPRTTVERETTAPRENSARSAFDDLFKL